MIQKFLRDFFSNSHWHLLNSIAAQEKKKLRDLTMTRIKILRMLFEYQMVGDNKNAEIENKQGFMFHCQNLQSGSPQNEIIMQAITNLLPHTFL